MRLPIYLMLFLSLVIKISFCNQRPVIGILTQEIYRSHLLRFKPSNYTYIAASYVKSIEASGGRVVPVFTNRSTEYYERIVSNVNGILIPGGKSAFNISSGIGRSTYEVFRIAKNRNNVKDYFPILGICQGFELLLISTNIKDYPLTRCISENVNLPLKLIPEMDDKSMLFKTMPDDIRKILLTEPVTANHHKQCMTEKKFMSMNLNEFWNPITLNKDEHNLTFISTIEAKDYPFVGVQFHPEKNAYEWEENDPHSWSAIYSVRYFYDWFVNESRKNEHTYANKSMLENELIYNYPATYVGKFNSLYEQVYFFND